MSFSNLNPAMPFCKAFLQSKKASGWMPKASTRAGKLYSKTGRFSFELKLVASIYLRSAWAHRGLSQSDIAGSRRIAPPPLPNHQELTTGQVRIIGGFGCCA
eukprot:sb/3478427/